MFIKETLAPSVLLGFHTVTCHSCSQPWLLTSSFKVPDHHGLFVHTPCFCWFPSQPYNMHPFKEAHWDFWLPKGHGEARSSVSGSPPTVSAMLLVIYLVGCGTKLGFHSWASSSRLPFSPYLPREVDTSSSVLKITPHLFGWFNGIHLQS